MEKRPPIFSLLLFLEEFVMWQPGTINTIVERFLLLALKSAQDASQWLTLLNPGLSILLFLVAVDATIGYVHSLLYNHISPDLILFMNRYSVIRFILAGLVAFWLLRQLMATLSGDVGSLMDLYIDKSFWTMLFVGIAAYKFVSPSR